MFRRKFHIPLLERANAAVKSLSLSGKLLFYGTACVFAGSAFFMLAEVSNAYLVAVPRQGGSLVEGVIGMPRFANPVLAVTDGDKDIAALVYSGLMRQMPDGSLAPDLAESYAVSPDGKTYTVTLRTDAVFHDGAPVTADDVEFTVKKIQDPAVKSVEYSNWGGVTVEKSGDRAVKFTLRQPYAPFIENLTVGILPKHLWQDVPSVEFSFSELNIEPVGSGPYRVSRISKSGSGTPASYSLVPFDRFVHDLPRIGTITIRFYANEKNMIAAFESGEIESMNSISPLAAARLAKRAAVKTTPLPRAFSVFFNQSENPALAAREVRQALDMSVNRQYIIDSVLAGFGIPLSGPVPPEFAPIAATGTPVSTGMIREANALLDKKGWILNAGGIREKKTSKGTTTLAFSISTTDAPELKETAEILRSQWKQIGADVSIKIFEGGYLNQNVIKPRKYDALLFGQVINRNLDLYAFWHSSESEDPGLNVALYANKTADKLLERMRVSLDHEERLRNYAAFAEEIRNDVPAVFLYAPKFIYVMPEKVNGVGLGHLAAANERFSDIFSWYIDTDKIWKIFLSVN